MVVDQTDARWRGDLAALVHFVNLELDIRHTLRKALRDIDLVPKEVSLVVLCVVHAVQRTVSFDYCQLFVSVLVHGLNCNERVHVIGRHNILEDSFAGLV